MKKHILIAGFTSIAILSAGCGGGDSDTAADSKTDEDVAAESDGPCPVATFSGTMSRIDDDNGGHTAADYVGDDFTAGKAFIWNDGIEAYLSNAEIEDSYNPNAAEGDVVVHVHMSGVTPFAAGDVVSLTSRGPRIDNAGTNSYTMGSIAENSAVTVIASTDTRICFDIEYSDDFQSISGTVSLPKDYVE